MQKILAHVPNTVVNVNSDREKNTIVETFPSAVCCGLFPDIYPVKYKIKSKKVYDETKYQMERLLKRFSEIEEIEEHVVGLIDKLEIGKYEITKKSHKHLEDKVDAFLSAYCPFSIYKGYASRKTFGDVENGFITIAIRDKNDYVSPHEAVKKIIRNNSKLTTEDISNLMISLGKLAESIDNKDIKQVEKLQELRCKADSILKRIGNRG